MNKNIVFEPIKVSGGSVQINQGINTNASQHNHFYINISLPNDPAVAEMITERLLGKIERFENTTVQLNIEKKS